MKLPSNKTWPVIQEKPGSWAVSWALALPFEDHNQQFAWISVSTGITLFKYLKYLDWCTVQTAVQQSLLVFVMQTWAQFRDSNRSITCYISLGLLCVICGKLIWIIWQHSVCSQLQLIQLGFQISFTYMIKLYLYKKKKSRGFILTLLSLFF